MDPIHVDLINGQQLEFDGHLITIRRNRSTGHFSRGETVIPISQISGVQTRPATWSVNGFVQFKTTAGGTGPIRQGHTIKDVVRDQNAVIFRKKHAAEVDRLVAAVRAAMSGGT